MTRDIIKKIDAVIGCQQCGGSLVGSVSDDFCSELCQHNWHNKVPATTTPEDLATVVSASVSDALRHLNDIDVIYSDIPVTYVEPPAELYSLGEYTIVRRACGTCDFELHQAIHESAGRAFAQMHMCFQNGLHTRVIWPRYPYGE